MKRNDETSISRRGSDMTAHNLEQKPSQARFERFLAMAQRLGCDWSGTDFERALRTLAPPKHGRGAAAGERRDACALRHAADPAPHPNRTLDLSN
jgi:hypothetical protein